MSNITLSYALFLKDSEGSQEYTDAAMDESVVNNKIRRPEKLRDKKRRWHWIKRNSETAYSNYTELDEGGIN